MTTLAKTVTLADFKRAIAIKDALTLADFYADAAVMQIIDRDNPPSKPREIKGRTAIAGHFDDLRGRAMAHKIEAGLAAAHRLAFTQTCTYPDGTRVFCSAMIELAGGKVAQQTMVQVWDI